jgi:Flp pilus assembly protein TadG
MLARQKKFLACAAGTTAVEFALIAPLLIMVVIGTIYAGTLVYSYVALQDTVATAARCYSVNATQCPSATAVTTYASQIYQGVGSPSFSTNLLTCGHQVSATLTLALNAGMANWSVPVTATACFP